MYQTENPCENGYFYNNLLVLNNKNIHKDKHFSDYMKSTFNYLPPDNMNKTIVVDGKELYSLQQEFNIISCVSLDKKYMMDLRSPEIFF
jgi:hypothetical protein